MALQPLGTFEGTGELLARMVLKGYCTIEDLDKSPPGALPEFKPVNTLRQWIDVNQAKWKEIQELYGVKPAPDVEKGPSPRDFITDDLPF